MIGTILKSRYDIISQLGIGGNGETFIVEDLHIPGTVKPRYLAKRLKPDIMDDETQRLFLQEAQILHNLSQEHDQIPKVIAFFPEQDNFYLIQELIFGHDLRQEFKPGQQCQESYAVKLLYDVLNVLSFVHQKRVIHRDIKPENIVRRQSDGKLFLIDFGAVKQVKQQTLLRTANINNTNRSKIQSSEGYTPNEQFNGNAQFSSDIYALGMTAVEALTGDSAVQLQNRLDNVGQIKWRDKANVSDNLADILTTMIKQFFGDRYQNAGEVLAVLGPVVSLYPFFSSSKVPQQAEIEKEKQRLAQEQLRLNAEKQAITQQAQLTEQERQQVATERARLALQQQQITDEKSRLALQQQQLAVQQQQLADEKARLAAQNQAILQQQQQRQMPSQTPANRLQTPRADYTKFDQLLAANNWQEADQECWNIMVKIMNNNVTEENCKNFPKDELRIIDDLWVKYSQGRFGFSVQKQIWIECGGTPGVFDNDVWKKFIEKTGWTQGGKSVDYNLTLNKKTNRYEIPYAFLPRVLGGNGRGAFFLL